MGVGVGGLSDVFNCSSIVKEWWGLEDVGSARGVELVGRSIYARSRGKEQENMENSVSYYVCEGERERERV